VQNEQTEVAYGICRTFRLFAVACARRMATAPDFPQAPHFARGQPDRRRLFFGGLVQLEKLLG
jgi:hypothetical protein